jgi:hypothetical protein
LGLGYFPGNLNDFFYFFLTFFTVPFFLQRNYMAKRDTADYVVSHCLPTKKQFSPVGIKAASAFSRAEFGGKTDGGPRGSYLEKEGKYDVQAHAVKVSFPLVSAN